MKNKVVEDYVDEDGCLHCGICRKRKAVQRWAVYPICRRSIKYLW